LTGARGSRLLTGLTRLGTTCACALLLWTEPVHAQQTCPPPGAEPLVRASESGAALRARSEALREAARGQSRPAGELRAQLERLIGEADLLPAAERIDAWLHAAGTLELVPGSDVLAGRTCLRAGELAREIADPRRRSLALGAAGGPYQRSGRGEEARDLTRQALFLAAEVDDAELLFRWQWQLARMLRDAGQADAALDELRRAARTARSLGPVALADPAGSPGALFSDLVDALLRRARAAPGPDAHQALLREARDALEALKVGELRDYFRDACLEAQSVVPSEAIPGALVVYPVVLEDRLELLVTYEGQLAQYVVPVASEELRREVLELRRALQRRGSYAFRARAERVYDWVVRPIAGLLAEGGALTLVFVPGSALRTIPLAALRDRDTGQYLIEQAAVATTPGLTLTEPRPIARERATLLAVGLSEAREGFPALTHVTRELEAVQESFPGVRLLDAGFSAARLEEQLSARAFDLVHIASHGEFGTDAAGSFVLTHEGKLGMEELARLVGMTRFRERPLELLTLSACETAAGDERAALGLAGIAVRAGARSALGTLWSVHDEATAILIERFYRELRTPGVSRALALQRAQLHLLRETPYRHPAYWSPLLLINSWL
jgi:CHAT domain-containing protein